TMNLSSTIARAGGELASGKNNYPRAAYGRLFPRGPFWEPPGRNEKEKLDYLFALSEEMYQDRSAENPEIPAGYTSFGQLIAHDVTFDARSSLKEKNDPVRLRDYRTPRLDLDCVYGRGPNDQPYLYSKRQPGKLLVGANAHGELDLPRNRDTSVDGFGTTPFDRLRGAIIGDARNDETILLSQLHLCCIRFHNRQIDEGRDFQTARRLTRWYYQW